MVVADQFHLIPEKWWWWWVLISQLCPHLRHISSYTTHGQIWNNPEISLKPLVRGVYHFMNHQGPPLPLPRGCARRFTQWWYSCRSGTYWEQFSCLIIIILRLSVYVWKRAANPKTAISIEKLSSGNLSKPWKITIFTGKTHYKWPFSVAMLVITSGSLPRAQLLATGRAQLVLLRIAVLRTHPLPSVNWSRTSEIKLMMRDFYVTQL